jgi:transglutaminase-like putative cysteine protease
VLPIDERTAELRLEVRAIADAAPLDATTQVSPPAPSHAPKSKAQPAPLEPTVPEDLAPNSFVQSDHPRVRQLANEAAAGALDPPQVALGLEAFVHQRMRARKTMTITFATAADVAESLSGDCSEHAVLLAALLRARGLPARMAIGLVYSPADRGFAFHMWNEVYVYGRWYPLDATLGQGRISATHIKLADTNLAGSGPLAALLPIGQFLGNVKLEVLEID